MTINYDRFDQPQDEDLLAAAFLLTSAASLACCFLVLIIPTRPNKMLDCFSST